MAAYTLLSSEPTVQVLSATVVNQVQYCTIQTNPSNVVASIPVTQATFNNNQAASELTNFAEAIEQIMALDQVIAGEGTQTVESSGLLVDNVAFTVGYPSPATPTTPITAEAVVQVNMLNFSDAEIGRTLLGEVEAIINGVYANLQSAAGG